MTATDQSTPAPMAPTGDPQAARRARREQLLALTNLDYPTQAERNAVAALLAVEFEESDRSRANSVDNAQYARHAWASVEHANERTRQGVERLRKAREQRNEAQQRAKTAEHILDAVRDARNWTAVYTALAPRYGWPADEARHMAKERVTSIVRNLQEQRNEARREAAEHKTNYLGACKTIADMHAAAVGGVRGPARGVVEDVADLRAERDRLRQQLTAAHRTYDAADSLRYSFGAAGGLTPGGVLTAAAIRDAQRRADEAAQQARSEIAAAQQAHDNLAALHNARRIDLAAALDAPHTASWPDLIEIAQQAQQADAAVNEAVRARKAAEQRARDTAATLREAENQLAKVRQRAERSDREGELLSAELTKAEAVAREAKKLLERRTETLRKRAEHVEAQVRAVREAIAHDFRADHRAIIEAALDGTAVPDADAPRPFSLTEQAAPRPLSGPCGRCGATTQHCDPRGRFVCREHNLAAYTTPITPREPQNVRTGDGHPVFELIDALTDSSALADEAASALIGRYYRAITSAPPADPAERPLAVAVHVDLTPEQLAEAARKAVEERARWQQRLREAVKP